MWQLLQPEAQPQPAPAQPASAQPQGSQQLAAAQPQDFLHLLRQPKSLCSKPPRFFLQQHEDSQQLGAAQQESQPQLGAQLEQPHGSAQPLPQPQAVAQPLPQESAQPQGSQQLLQPQLFLLRRMPLNNPPRFLQQLLHAVSQPQQGSAAQQPASAQPVSQPQLGAVAQHELWLAQPQPAMPIIRSSKSNPKLVELRHMASTSEPKNLFSFIEHVSINIRQAIPTIPNLGPFRALGKRGGVYTLPSLSRRCWNKDGVQASIRVGLCGVGGVTCPLSVGAPEPAEPVRGSKLIHPVRSGRPFGGGAPGDKFGIGVAEKLP